METVELNYKQLGEGQPILILHGLFGMLDNWMRVGKELAEEYQVFLLDLRNHGRSPHTEAFGIAEMAADVRAFMDNHWIHDAWLIGHSMGAKVAMHLALDDPGRIRKLISVDMAPKAYDRNHDHIIDALQNLDPGKHASRADLDEALSEDIADEQVRLFLMKNVKRIQSGGYAWRSNVDGIAAGYDNILEEIEGDPFPNPACFIRGGKSRYVLDSDLPHIKTLFPKYKLITIDEAGHWVHAEAPDQFVSETRRFLGSS